MFRLGSNTCSQACWALALASVLACSARDSDVGGLDASNELREPTTVTISGVVRNIFSSAALGGVEVSLVEDAALEPVLTAADGSFDFPGIALGTDATLRFRVEGYPNHLSRTYAVGEAAEFLPETPFHLMEGALIGVIAELLEIPFEDFETHGIAWMRMTTASGAGIPGATIDISPITGSGPFYTDESGVPARTASETGAVGVATFAFEEPGTAVITAHHPTLTTCTMAAPDAETSARIIVEAGSISIAGTAICR